MELGQEIWIFIERRNKDIEEVSLETLCKGRKIAFEFKEATSAVIIGDQDPEVIKQLSGYGADKIHFVDHPELQSQEIELCTEALHQLIEKNRPRLVLFGASIFGNDIACRIAARMDAALFANCMDISLSEDKTFLYVKSTHGGKVAGTFVCPSPGLQMATVISGVFERTKPDFGRKTETILFHPQLNLIASRLKRIGLIKADPEKIGLDEAEIIVSGGRGMGCAENFEKLKVLSKMLGGAVGASLGAVDDGLAERKNLVGQTGMTVTPKLYLACGISGSIYHVLGMKDAKAIVAVNKDRHAEIFKYSDMGIVGDAVEIIDAITNRLDAMVKDKTDES